MLADCKREKMCDEPPKTNGGYTWTIRRGGAADEFLTTRLLSQRYKKTPKTIRDWELSGVLPPATRINGKKYWRLSVLEQAEREGMGSRKHEPLDAA